MIVDKWQEQGIPQDVVEKGIRQTFTRGNNSRISINQCDCEVRRLWQWDKRNRHGLKRELIMKDAVDVREKEFILESIMNIISFANNKSKSEARAAECYRQIAQALVKIAEEIKSLTKIDSLKYETVVEELFDRAWRDYRATLDSDFLMSVEKEVFRELASHKSKMTAKAYQETVKAVLEERLQELCGYERRRLFNMTL